ncbi:MAG: glycan-binding surface protein [Prevotella sp.]|nr:glycan-binding surface protein [Prevotella sp.]
MQKRKINRGLTLLVLFMLSMFQVIVTSCSDKENTGGGIPEITAVRVPNPAAADSFFVKSVPGQVIVIVGKNLDNVMKVYINDQEVSFNSTMNTDHSLIVTVPTEEKGFKLTAFNSDLKDEIRVVTSHGETSYAFKITAPYPTIARIQGKYPRGAGDTLFVYGSNLVDVEKVYFTDIPATKLDSTSWTEIEGNTVDAIKYFSITQNHYLDNKTQAYTTDSKIGVITPEIPYESGTIVVKTAGGYSYMPYYKRPGVPTINSISSDFPEIGEEVVITGTEFVQVQSITFGDISLTNEDIKVSPSEDSIKFICKSKPTVGSGSTITLTTPGGTVSEDNFFNYSFLLFNFDDLGLNNGWGPDAVYETATLTSVPYTSDGNYARFKETQSQTWWGAMIYYKYSADSKFPLPSYDLIPADASLNDVYLAIEVYNNNSDYNNGLFGGYLRYFIQQDAEDPVPTNNDSGNPNPVGKVNQFDNFTWVDYNAGTFSHPLGVLSDINGDHPVGKWYRHVLPLSKFGKLQGQTYKDLVNMGLNQIRIQCLNQTVTTGKVDVMFDNVRIYYNKK